MKITLKTIRTILLGTALLGVILAGYAGLKIIFASQVLITDDKGCIWEEVNPLKSTDHDKTSKTGYQTKAENGKQYLLRECKKQEVQ